MKSLTATILLLAASLLNAVPATAQSYDCAAQSEVPEAECDALVALYDSTDGDNWTDNSGWLSAPVSQWYGVEVSEGYVTALDLFLNSLSGSIPPELGQLTNLRRLDLYNNDLSGAIPAEIGQLTNLEALNLFLNNLSGSIPVELGQLANLQRLDLSENNLSEAIPVELGQLANLQRLDFYNNGLSGSIPVELGQLTNLEVLALSENDLSGAIPAELGQLTSLQNLYLFGNDLNGSIPPELGQLTSLSLLRLDGNNLSDAIPSELGQLANLQSLALSENNLSGAIPVELGQLTNLEVLALSENDLSGAIPAELGQLTNLQSLYLFSNSLSGAIPLSFTNLTVLERFWFNDTSLCEPQDPDLQAWLDGIDDLQRTDVLCLAAPEEASLSAAIAENEDGSVTVVLSWAAVDDAAAYHLQISDADFAETDAAKHLDIIHEATVTDTAYTVPDEVITPGMDFYWRVRAGNSEDGPWSSWASAAATATTIEPIGDGLLQRFALEANYPNPFNPETTITYAIPEAVHVTLIVYDVLGRERVRLVDEQLAPGVYEARFDAGGLPSGVYLYRLEAGSYRETKALTLAK